MEVETPFKKSEEKNNFLDLQELYAKTIAKVLNECENEKFHINVFTNNRSISRNFMAKFPSSYIIWEDNSSKNKENMNISWGITTFNEEDEYRDFIKQESFFVGSAYITTKKDLSLVPVHFYNLNGKNEQKLKILFSSICSSFSHFKIVENSKLHIIAYYYKAPKGLLFNKSNILYGNGRFSAFKWEKKNVTCKKCHSCGHNENQCPFNEEELKIFSNGVLNNFVHKEKIKKKKKSKNTSNPNNNPPIVKEISSNNSKSSKLKNPNTEKPPIKVSPQKLNEEKLLIEDDFSQKSNNEEPKKSNEKDAFIKASTQKNDFNNTRPPVTVKIKNKKKK